MYKQITAPYRPGRYFTLTFAATFALWFAGGRMSFQEDPAGHYMLLMLAGLLAPCLISGWMQLISADRALRAHALDRLVNLRRIPLGQLPVLLFMMPLIVFVTVMLSLALGESTDQLRFAEGFSFSAGCLPVLLLLACAALFEELGWRGYAFDSLLSGRSYLSASLWFGVLWSLWHLPLLWVNHSYQYNLLQENGWYAVNFYVSIVPMGVIMCWVCARSNQSVAAAVLFHFSINISQELLAITQNTKCLETIVLALVAALLVHVDPEVFARRSGTGRSGAKLPTPMAPVRSALLLVLCLLAAPHLTEAGDAETETAVGGFSGTVQAGALILHTDSQLSTAGSNHRVRNPNAPADPNIFASGLAAFSLQYEFGSGTALYAGTPMEVTRGIFFEAGFRRPLGGGTLDLSANWQPMETAWEDPYRQAGAKSETPAHTYGLQTQWQAIGGGPWELGYGLRRTRVENDVIGSREADLRRSGWTHELEIKRSFTLGPGLRAIPGLGAAHAHTEGASNRYSEARAELVLQGVRPPWMLVGLVSGAYQHYHKEHPLYGRVRREAVVTVFAQVMRRHLFEVENLFASLGGGYVGSDANIDFFDSRSLITLATVGVDF